MYTAICASICTAKKASGNNIPEAFIFLGRMKPQPGLLAHGCSVLAVAETKVQLSVSYLDPRSKSTPGKSICPGLARPYILSHVCPRKIEILVSRTKTQIMTKNRKIAARKNSKSVRNDSRYVRFFRKEQRKNRKNKERKDKNTSATDKKKDG